MLLITFGFIAATNVHAQSEETARYECVYEYQTTNPKGVTDTYSTTLQIGSRAARFYGDEDFDQIVYQNQSTGKLTVYSVIPPDYFTYTESANTIAWTLSERTDTICGYVCQQAMGEYGGRTWTVWYAQNIPVPFGPWKLCGLPGLVMKAVDTEGIHHFEAIIFRNGTSAIPQPDFPHVVTTTREKFIKAKNRYEADPMGSIPPESISEMTVVKRDNGKDKILINGVPLRLRPNGYVPLEVE